LIGGYGDDVGNIEVEEARAFPHLYLGGRKVAPGLSFVLFIFDILHNSLFWPLNLKKITERTPKGESYADQSFTETPANQTKFVIKQRK
jgi:hypothetical protein